MHRERELFSFISTFYVECKENLISRIEGLIVSNIMMYHETFRQTGTGKAIEERVTLPLCASVGYGNF